MKSFFLFIIPIVCFVSSCKNSVDYSVNKQMSSQERDSLTVKMEPYIADVPDGVDKKNKTAAIYRPMYAFVLPFFSLRQYHITDDSIHYFPLWKVAPSVKYNERIAIVGRYKMDSKRNIYDFEELFNTYKMDSVTLDQKGKEIFQELIEQQGDYLKLGKSREMIEFPNDIICYDKSNKSWKVCR